MSVLFFFSFFFLIPWGCSFHNVHVWYGLLLMGVQVCVLSGTAAHYMGTSALWQMDCHLKLNACPWKTWSWWDASLVTDSYQRSASQWWGLKGTFFQSFWDSFFFFSEGQWKGISGIIFLSEWLQSSLWPSWCCLYAVSVCPSQQLLSLLLWKGGQGIFNTCSWLF